MKVAGVEVITGVAEVCSVPGWSGLRLPQAPEGGPFGIAREDATRKSRETSACRAMAFSKAGRGTVRIAKKLGGALSLTSLLSMLQLSQQAMVC